MTLEAAVVRRLENTGRVTPCNVNSPLIRIAFGAVSSIAVERNVICGYFAVSSHFSRSAASHEIELCGIGEVGFDRRCVDGRRDAGVREIGGVELELRIESLEARGEVRESEVVDPEDQASVRLVEHVVARRRSHRRMRCRRRGRRRRG